MPHPKLLTFFFFKKGQFWSETNCVYNVATLESYLLEQLCGEGSGFYCEGAATGNGRGRTVQLIWISCCGNWTDGAFFEEPRSSLNSVSRFHRLLFQNELSVWGKCLFSWLFLEWRGAHRSLAAAGNAGEAGAPVKTPFQYFSADAANRRHIISPSSFSCQTFPSIENSQVLAGWHPIRGKISVYSPPVN